MDLRNARYFREVAQTGSLRKAAERLRIAPSAISRSIALLEEEVGIQLFQRAGRGMIPTAAGELYMRYVQEALRNHDLIRTDLADLRGLRRGTIRIVSIEGVVASFIADVITRFRQRYPGVVFSLTVAGSNLVSRAIRARDADLGIGAGSEDETGLEMVHHIRDPLLAVMSPQHPLAGSQQLDAVELMRSHPVAVPDPTFAIRHQLEACCRQARIALEPALVTNSVDGMRSFARLGGGITFLPWLAIRQDVAEGRLIGVPVRQAALNKATINIFTPIGWRLSPSGAEFLKDLKETGDLLMRSRKRRT
ncbi:MAG: LysR family transcriptional regulator [Dongiaceae bacterium]